jgi:DNA-binding SARP family transcriptional activator/predicted ATPase
VATLRMQLLGPPRIEVAGAPLDVDTRKGVALLSYLAVTGRRQSREHLCGLLWPDSDPARARAALRRTLSVVQRATGSVLEVTGDHLGLTGDRSWCDVGDFRARRAETRGHGHPPDAVCPACIGPLEAAVALPAGPLLDGFTLRDSPAFGEWRYLEAEALRREHADCLDRLIRAFTRAGSFAAGTVAARERLALDPLHEQAHRQLMLLLTWSGHRTEAIRQYRACVAALRHELGVEPLDRTTQLYHAIVSGNAPPPPTSPAGDARPPPRIDPLPARLPLVGREREVAAVRAAHASVSEGGHLVVVTGEVGIGRTRLADELVSEVARSGGRTITVRCHPGEGDLPYGPIVALLRRALGRWPELWRALPEHDQVELAALLPELATVTDGSAPPTRDPTRATERFVSAVVRGLVAAVQEGEAAGVVLVDDGHHADEATLRVLRYLAHRLDEYPLCLALTWRTDDQRHARRLRALLAELGPQIPRTIVDPRRLTRVEVGEIADRLGRALDPAQLTRLAADTEGVPLIVEAYLRASTAPAGPRSSSRPVLPGDVREAFQPRLDALDGLTHQILTTAAVIGRSFDLETLVRASGRSEDEVVGAMDELVARGLIRETGETLATPPGGPVFDFSHQMLRALVEAATTSARRRLLHGRVADALTAPDRGVAAEELSGTIARHLAVAGRTAESAERHRIAGLRALRLHANAEALSHLDAALSYGHPRASELHAAVGDIHTLGGDYPAALAAYELAAATASGADAAAIDQRIAAVHLRAGDIDSATAHLDAALAVADVAPARRVRLLADASLVHLHAGAVEAAQALADEALATVDQDADALSGAQVHNLLGILARRSGRLDKAHQHLARSVSLSETVGGLDAQVASRNNLALVCSDAGDQAAAAAYLREALRRCTRLGDRHREAALHNNLADVLHRRGHDEEAMVELKRAVGLFAAIGRSDRLQPEIWKLQEW